VVGVRALTADLLPAVGPLSDGVYTAVTHSGITLAPALGELVAAEVLGRAEEPLLAPFRPDRLTRRTP
jgi:glycine/D-amino acid oxidase-like deaminating enzyme